MSQRYEVLRRFVRMNYLREIFTLRSLMALGIGWSAYEVVYLGARSYLTYKERMDPRLVALKACDRKEVERMHMAVMNPVKFRYEILRSILRSSGR